MGMNRLRIGYVVQRYGPEVNGGAEAHCRSVAERLARTHAVDVVTTRAIDYVTWQDEYPEGATEINGVRVLRFGVDRPRDNNVFGEMSNRVFGGPHTEADEIQWMKLQGPYSSKLLKYLKEHRTVYDVFLFQTYLYCTTFFGLPIVSDRAILIPTAHDELPIYLGIFDTLFRAARYLICLTPEELAFLRRRFFQHSLRGEVVGAGIEPLAELPADPDWEAIAAKIGNSPFVLYVGRIDESKGCKTLIDYFTRYAAEEGRSDLKLVMMGKPVMPVPDHPQLLATGFVSETAKLHGIHNCSLMVVPSPYESLCIAALEAWQMKKPVLANGDCAVLRGQCIRSNGGLWYTAYDEFREGLNCLLNDSALAKAIGRQGEDYVRRNYAWEEVEKKLNRILLSVARAPRDRNTAHALEA
jgi:glycosyltransferase involved in cell wall biosynthesis